VAGAEAAIAAARRRITLASLASGGPAEQGLDGYQASDRARIERAMRELNEIADAGSLTLARLTVAASRLTDIAGGDAPVVRQNS
jgi:NAD-specific glutamate dehydrogenase